MRNADLYIQNIKNILNIIARNNDTLILDSTYITNLLRSFCLHSNIRTDKIQKQEEINKIKYLN